MAQAAIKIEKKAVKTTKEKIEDTLTDELIIGICSRIGSYSNEVINSIHSRLEEYNYEVEIIKVSDYINHYYKVAKKLEAGHSEGYTNLMYKIKGGNFIRDEYSNNSILIELAIKKIREDREDKSKSELKTAKEYHSRRKCYIIDSIKNKEELLLLRSVYRDIFYLISIFTPDQERKIHFTEVHNLNRSEVEEIIDIDEHEDFKHGQDVRNVFINGDFMIRTVKDNIDVVSDKIERFFHLIFQTKVITPDYHENAMYHATAAAGNSACLSRQVGAVITDKEGNVLIKGWNDVPKYGGNLYKDSDLNDERCFILGECSNDSNKNNIISEIIDNVKDSEAIKNLVSSNQHIDLNKPTLKIVKNDDNHHILVEEISKILLRSRIKGLIEFSRAIHAEMHAIIMGSQMSGDKMVDGKLYCTTYPCHNCTRHIVLAGIKEIYYIEPYKKSLGTELHYDTITEDEKDDTKVILLPFEGVAPRRFLELFQMNNIRKDEKGKLNKVNLNIAVPKVRLSLQSLPNLEAQAIHALERTGLLDE